MSWCPRTKISAWGKVLGWALRRQMASERSQGRRSDPSKSKSKYSRASGVVFQWPRLPPTKQRWCLCELMSPSFSQRLLEFFESQSVARCSGGAGQIRMLHSANHCHGERSDLTVVLMNFNQVTQLVRIKQQNCSVGLWKRSCFDGFVASEEKQNNVCLCY